MNGPLISFVLISYNQEGFIREAVESALSQSYSPLEILIQDDCSSDRSFEIIQQMVAAYRGPHSVQCLRNPANLGIARNLNRAMELCRGRLIVVAAGDDISLPMRTEVIYRAWEDSKRMATALFSCYTVISKDGAEQGLGGTRREADGPGTAWRLEGELFRFLSKRDPMVHGCSAAYSPDLLSCFGPVWGDMEDVVLCFRTLAMGQLLYINQPLVKYRRHGENASFYQGGELLRSFENRERRLRRGNEITVKTYDNLLADIDTLLKKGRIAPDECARLKVEAQRVRKPYERERQMMDQDALGRLRTIAATAVRGDLRGALRAAPRCLPRPIYRALYLLRERWRSGKDTGGRPVCGNGAG
jgi:glycosyltransferase involved in cell wall biosynthesis